MLMYLGRLNNCLLSHLHLIRGRIVFFFFQYTAIKDPLNISFVNLSWPRAHNPYSPHMSEPNSSILVQRIWLSVKNFHPKAFRTTQIIRSYFSLDYFLILTMRFLFYSSLLFYYYCCYYHFIIIIIIIITKASQQHEERYGLYKPNDVFKVHVV